MVPTEADDELDLRHYLDVVTRRKWIIIVATVVVVVVALGLTLQQTPRYRATAEVLLQSNDAEQRLGGATQIDPRSDQNRVATEIGVIESNLVQDAVEEQLGREPDVIVDADGDTDIVDISATSEDPDEAAAEANLYASTYVEWRRQRTIDDLLAAQQTVQAEIDSLQAQLDALDEPVQELEEQLFAAGTEEERAAIRSEIEALEASQTAERTSLQNTLALYQAEMSSLQVSQRITRTGGVQIISEARRPDDPFSPQPLRNGALALAVGLMLGVGIAFLLETLDDRVRSKEHLERLTGWTTIGLIPVIERAKGGEHDLATVEAPSSPAAEAYRALRTSVQFVGLERQLDVIQVTSAKSGDGKTTTASNLAVTLAQAGRRVVLLDADLRKPRLHHEFGLDNTIGFTSMLLDSTTRADAFRRTAVERLVVVTSGPPPPNPSELLSLKTTQTVIELIGQQCDVLIIDSPPVLPVTDPLVISRYVDGVLVVTDATTARSKELGRTRELLEQANAEIIGISVNRVDVEGGYGYGYGYGYGEAYGTPAGEAGGDGAAEGDRRSRIFQR